MDFSLIALCLAIAYGLGSIPTGYLIAKRAGIDIREHGSGSTGATNVWRVVGKTAGITVFLVDFAKGIGAILCLQWLIPQSEPWLVVAVAFTAIVGHSLPVWINWRGGKSVATGLGILCFLHWQTALLALAVWLVIMAIWRTVSLASMLAALSTPLFLQLFAAPTAYQLFALLGSFYILWTHRTNIQRLLKAEELSFATPPEKQ
jgi:glycerol-3-phosphate acyltransferase PlsY